MASDEESFLLESDHPIDYQDSQRTSTPTKILTSSQSSDGEKISTQGVGLSPVVKSSADANHQHSSLLDQSLVSPHGFNSAEESASMYNSALSRMDSTVTSDSYITSKEADNSDISLASYGSLKSEGSSVFCQLEESLPYNTHLHDETLSEYSTKHGAWQTALGSIQNYSDLKDSTIGQKSSHDIVSSNGSSSPDGDFSESTYKETVSTIENDQDSQHVLSGILHDAKNPDMISLNQQSPDLQLLNEICEEATYMTIKEALVYSLNPGVRSGLCEGRLSLNESEILALELYCEKFIDNLMSQLLDGHWSKRISEETNKTKKVEDKSKMTQKLSSVGLEKLKSNCDRFVQSIITESLHDSCFGLWSNDKDDRNFGSQKDQTVESKDKSYQALLPLIKESKSIQDYIGYLSADIIKSALANLSTSIATENSEKNEHMTLNKNGFSDTCKSSERRNLSNKHDNDMWNSQNDATCKGLNNEGNILNGLTTDDKHKEQHTLDQECIFSSSLPGALETSLEFDSGEWEGPGVLEAFHSLDTGEKQKIMLRELSFDDHADVCGTELLAPVFLAIAEENDDNEIQGMRKKALSIENLCGIIDEPAEENSRPRSYSAPKRLKDINKTAERNLIQEEDSSVRLSESEGEYEGDEEGEDDDIENDKDNENQDGEIDTDLEQGHWQDKHTIEVTSDDKFRWHTVSVNGREKVLDLKLLEPYMKVISHGGYFSDTRSTIVVIAACYLPDRSLANYDYLMEQLFFYVISTLELLAIHEDYYLVYLNGGTSQQNTPYVSWMNRFYQYIEGGLKKRMREMFIVHPNFRLKVIITLAKPFLNANFWRKLSFVPSLGTLSSHIPVDYIYIPDEVIRVDPAYRRVHNG